MSRNRPKSGSKKASSIGVCWPKRCHNWCGPCEQKMACRIIFNQRFRDYTGATWEQLQGYGWSQFVHPDDYERTLATRTHALRTGIPYEVAYRFREGQTGLYRWFLARAMPVRDDTGQIVKWFGTCTDIDDQKRTEKPYARARHASVPSSTPILSALFPARGKRRC